MSYQLQVRFTEPNLPNVGELKEALSSYHPIVNASAGTVSIFDPISGRISLEIAGREHVENAKLAIPYFGSVEALVTGYSVAQTLATRFKGTFEDSQLSGPPSIFLAKQEWRKRRGPLILERAFNGQIPLDLKLRISQGRLLEKVEYEVSGTDVVVKWKSQLKSGQHRISLLSLREPQERVERSGRWYGLLAPGLMFLFFATTVQGVAQGVLASIGFGLFFISPILYFFVKFRTIVVPGEGASLFLNANKHSNSEVFQFLDSIERVKAALLRYGATMLRDAGEPAGVV